MYSGNPDLLKTSSPYTRYIGLVLPSIADSIPYEHISAIEKLHNYLFPKPVHRSPSFYNSSLHYCFLSCSRKLHTESFPHVLTRVEPFHRALKRNLQAVCRGPALLTCRAVAVRWPTSGLCYNGLPSF